ncbi:hypothetical protein ACVI1L_004745 [Bradyrhizobium sp. USDA 4516]
MLNFDPSSLASETRQSVVVPLPACMTGQARPHSISATLAWFTPVQAGRQSYRSVRLSLIASDDIDQFRVLPAKSQPDVNQPIEGQWFPGDGMVKKRQP